MDKSGIKPGRLIYGGSFNPVHIGHLRLALEACRLLGPFVRKVDFVPAACPPHKKSSGLLPFSMRAELVRLSIDGISCLECNVIEEDLPEPSYSERTIRAIAAMRPDEELFFLLGSSVFALLPEWRNGRDLPRLCNFAIAPRGDLDFAGFVAMAQQIWPGNVIVPQKQAAGLCACGPGMVSFVELSGGGKLFYLPVPFLDVSATYIRKLWLCGEDVDFLLPGQAIALLDRERKAVEACWRGND